MATFERRIDAGNRTATTGVRAAAIALVLASALGSTAAAAADCNGRTPSLRSVEAVVIVLSYCWHATSLLEDREFMGFVVETTDGYIGSAQSGERRRDRVHLRIVRRPGERLVALWHTHGAPGHLRELFSPTDTRLANRLEVPFYLTTPSGEFRVYYPGRTTPALHDDARQVLPRGAAEGEAVPGRAAAAL